MADKLEERLRAVWAVDCEPCGLVNPDGPEAADEIARLKALVDEMREVLADAELPDRLVKIGHHLTGCHEQDKARDVWEAGRLLRALLAKAQPPVSYDQ